MVAQDQGATMTADGKALEALNTRLAELADLDSAGSLLEWDHQTMMPAAGAAARAHSVSTLRRVRHERFISDDTGRLLEAAATELDGYPPESDQASIVRVASRRWEKARRVPVELAAEIAHAGAEGHDAWIKARANSDFAAFAPYLERNIELARRYVECFDWFECPYDALLDDHDPGMRTTEVKRLFDELRAELVPLLRALAEHSDRVSDACLHGKFPIPAQRELVDQVLALMGFEPSAWRIDDTVHPFEISIGAGDTRITTRWEESFLPGSLYSAIHECGHGLYESGIPAALKRTTIGHGESLSVHESQSRMWENMVGRSREFCGVLAPRAARLFGISLDADTLYRAVNRVAPSLIRVEADEATYGLHIIMRFELEQDLIEGRLRVSELPEVWNARFKEYFGLDVPDDAHGVLQDVHWSGGTIGYFPTYALGNLIAGMLWERAHAELPELDEQIGRGELMPLREWLRERIHRHGCKFTTSELLERALGEPIAVAPFIAYLKRKLSDVYGVAL
jgi:carboxypeptidase Taq